MTLAGRPDACAANEQLITGALFCSVCWRYKLDRHRCPDFKEHGFRLVAKGKKPFGVRYAPDRERAGQGG